MRCLILCLFFITHSHAVLIDKILAVIDGHPITYSDTIHIKKQLKARTSISPHIYGKVKTSSKDLAKIIIHRKIIRKALEEIGYVISAEQVNAQIEDTQKRLRLDRMALLEFLNSNGLSFQEYFDLTQEAIEYGLFASRVIRPLISISEQQVKNAFFEKRISDKTLDIKYTLVDYVLPIKKAPTNLRPMVLKYHNSGIIPEKYKEIQTSDLGEITEDGLNTTLKKLLKSTKEGDLSKGIFLNGNTHFFFVKNKDLVASDIYTQTKEYIRRELIEKEMNKIMEVWFQRQYSKHFLHFTGTL